jgi:hypothetical protein
VPAAASGAATSAGPVASGAPSTAPPPRVADEFQGYLGTRPIRATLLSQAEHALGAGPEAESWSFSGSMRFLGKTTRRLRGRTEAQPLSSASESLSIDGCSFDASDDKGTIVSSIEGTCALGGDLWSFRGMARAVGSDREEPFALREISRPADFDRYHRALLRTPRAAHDCAPLVGIEDVVKSKSGATLVLYRLGFPCSYTSEDPFADPAPVLGPVYLATIDESAPERFLRTGIVLKQSEPEDHFELTRYAWAPDLQAFELTQHHNQYRGSSAHHILWLVAGDRLGAVVDLPPDERLPTSVCGTDAHSFTLHQVDLDGRAPLDLLIQSVHRVVSPECNAPPPTTTEVGYSAYTVDPKKLSFLPAPLPDKARLEALVANGKVPEAVSNPK